MRKTIHDLDKSLRPREKMIKEGYKALSDEELLAILIATGSKKKNSIELAREILETFSYDQLNKITVEELSVIDGIKTAKASTIVAALQFGKRVNQKVLNKDIEVIKGSKDVYLLMKNYFISSTKEHFYTILLNAKNAIISIEHISTGDLTSSIVNPREVYTPAVKRSARSIVFVHNHPSGNPQPSRDDILITQRLVEAGNILDIKVLDHLVIGLDDYYSFKENNRI
jgi:DNA repair protein RadC